MDTPRAILNNFWDMPLEAEAEFNSYTDECNVPPRLKMPGFLYARRFRAQSSRQLVVRGDQPVEASGTIGKYLTFFETTGVQAFETDVYLRRATDRSDRDIERARQVSAKLTRHIRNVYVELPTSQTTIGRMEPVAPSRRVLLYLMVDLHPEDEEAFNQSQSELIPQRFALPGFIAARRFRIWDYSTVTPKAVPGIVGRYLTMYEFSNIEALDASAVSKLGPEVPFDLAHRWTRLIRNVYEEIETPYSTTSRPLAAARRN